MTQNQPNFKPILFSGDMVEAINNGTKTQTRRTFKTYNKGGMKLEAHQIEPGEAQFFSPYGKIGDVLWVRETFVYRSKHDRYYYRADYPDFEPYSHNGWKPSIFMPKAACRIFLKITNIRLERLQSISEDDCIKEGVKEIHPYPFVARWKNYMIDEDLMRSPYLSFQSLWVKINGKESWNENPWLWVVEFEQIDKPNNFI